MFEEYIGFVIVLFLLSMICERLADFLKNFLSEANFGFGRWIKKTLSIGNLLQKGEPGSIEEERRYYRILKINIYCGCFTAIALHADLFNILEHKDEPFNAIGWDDVDLIGQFKKDWLQAVGNFFVFLLGSFATGFFISFGSKFWHDLLDLLYQTKNYKRLLNEPDIYKTDNIKTVERLTQVYQSEYIKAAHFEAKQKFSTYPEVKAVDLKKDQNGYYFEVTLTQPVAQIGKYYAYTLSDGTTVSVRISQVIIAATDTIKAHSLDLSDKIFGIADPENWGTMGCLVQPCKDPSKRYILTCSHNLLNPKKDLPVTPDAVKVGAPKFATTSNFLGTVSSAIRDTEVDVALVEIPRSRWREVDNLVPKRGQPQKPRTLTSDDVNVVQVLFYGATSKKKEGIVTGIYCDVKMTYSEDEHLLINLISVSDNGQGLSEEGDSGSVVLDNSNDVIGLIVGGNSRQSYILPIDTILTKLNIELI